MLKMMAKPLHAMNAAYALYLVIRCQWLPGVLLSRHLDRGLIQFKGWIFKGIPDCAIHKTATIWGLMLKYFLSFMPCPSMWSKQFWSVQKGFGLTKLIWNWPQWFGHDQNEMVTTKMNWSGPNVIHFGRKSQFGPDQFILVVTISFWLRQNHYGQVQINLVTPKPF